MMGQRARNGTWTLAAIAIAFVVLGGAVSVAPSAVALIVPATAAVLGLAFLVRWWTPTNTGATDLRMLRWTLGAFAIHLAIGMAITHSGAATQYFGADAGLYHQGAGQLARAWGGHGPAPVLPPGKEGFFYALGGLYYVFGAHPEAGLVLNAFLGAALVPLVTDITRRLFGSNAARYAAPLVVLLPGMLMWISQLLREACILFLIALAVDLALRLSERVRVWPLAGLCISVALMFTVRANVAYVLLGGLVVGLILSRRHVITGVGLGVGILTVCTLIMVSAGVGYSGYRVVRTADLSQVNVIRLDSSASAASGYGRGQDVSSPGRALAYLPYGVSEFALGPLPWQVSGTRQLPAIVDVIVLWALVPSIARGLRVAWRKHQRGAAILLIPAAIAACMLALLVANFGTVVRERTQVVVLLIPFMAAGLSVRCEREPAGPAVARQRTLSAAPT